MPAAEDALPPGSIMYDDYKAAMAELFSSEERDALDPDDDCQERVVAIADEYDSEGYWPTGRPGRKLKDGWEVVSHAVRVAVAATVIGDAERASRELNAAYSLLNGTYFRGRGCACDLIEKLGHRCIEIGYPHVADRCRYVRCPKGPSGQSGIDEVEPRPPEEIKADITADLLILRDGEPADPGVGATFLEDLYDRKREKPRWLKPLE